MAPVESKKRASNRSIESTNRADIKVPLKSPSTPTGGASPVKKCNMRLNARQKQALIDNLQLEVTERARRLRAQYQLQAQGLRSRIEIRINRIPMSLRKLTIGDLLEKSAEQEQRRNMPKPPAVPAKDTPRASPRRSMPARAQTVSRSYKRMSTEISGDKENDVENVDGTKKRARVPPADTARVRLNQVLSPTSSNCRAAIRERPASPTKSLIARPGSPLKALGTSRSAAGTTVYSSMVEKAKASRARGTRKATAVSETSSASNGTTAASRARRNAAATTAKAPPSRPATRTGRRASNTSEISEGSVGTVGTVVRKTTTATKPASSTTRSTVMGTIRKGVTGGARKAAAAKSAASTVTATAGGRVLRNRG